MSGLNGISRNYLAYRSAITKEEGRLSGEAKKAEAAHSKQLVDLAARELSLAEAIMAMKIMFADERLIAITREILETAAVVVENEAKREIGSYQADIQPFIDWPELAQSTKDDRVLQGYSENDPGLRDGTMRESISHHVEVAGASEGVAIIGSNDQHLEWFELGTNKQPPRSVLGSALVHKTKSVTRIIGQRWAGALVGKEVFDGSLPIE